MALYSVQTPRRENFLWRKPEIVHQDAKLGRCPGGRSVFLVVHCAVRSAIATHVAVASWSAVQVEAIGVKAIVRLTSPIYLECRNVEKKKSLCNLLLDETRLGG